MADFLECYYRGLEMAKSVICATIPTTLSVSLTSARAARELLVQEFPGADITVVNSHTALVPEALMVIAAARAAQEGKGKEETLSLIEGLIPRVDMFLALQTIEYLDKGGTACRHRAGGGIPARLQAYDPAQGRSVGASGQG